MSSFFLAMASDDVERASKIEVVLGEKRREGGKGKQIKKKEMKSTDFEVDVHVSTYTTFKQRLNYYYY